MKMGSYVLLEQIGQGGMGVVYRARHEATGQIVAVKVMTAESMREPVLLKRFAKEGMWKTEAAKAVCTLKALPGRQVFMRKVQNRWFLENKQN